MADDGDSTTAEVVKQLESLEDAVSSPDERRRARRIRRLGEQLYALERRALGNVEDRIDKYTTRDVTEAATGSTLFALPLLVEDGIYDIGTHFATQFVYGVPFYFLGNVLFVVAITAGLLYFSDFRDVEVTYVLGFVPRRLVAVLGISFLIATVTMALWGRLDTARPFLAVCQISVVWTAGAFGAGLGDILPGESEGADIRDLLESLG